MKMNQMNAIFITLFAVSLFVACGGAQTPIEANLNMGAEQELPVITISPIDNYGVTVTIPLSFYEADGTNLEDLDGSDINIYSTEKGWNKMLSIADYYNEEHQVITFSLSYLYDGDAFIIVLLGPPGGNVWDRYDIIAYEDEYTFVNKCDEYFGMYDDDEECLTQEENIASDVSNSN